MGKRKKKFTEGEATEYISRNVALKKLQLNLKQFRTLCILKGIYPREPKERKRAQGGKGGIKTLYAKKDIQFLLHEPNIWKLWEGQALNKKKIKAKHAGNFEHLRVLTKNKPRLKMDHIIKERYPTFIDALSDLDDCLTMCFFYATLPKFSKVPRAIVNLARRLTLEFQHAVIASRSLRKAFISVKGFYFQAEIKGQTITWIVPHQFTFNPASKLEADFGTMSTFVQFYINLLGFVNFKLFHQLNLVYPPKLNFVSVTKTEKSLVDPETYIMERVAALNTPLMRAGPAPVDDDVELDQFPDGDDPEEAERVKKEFEQVAKLKTLFNGLKVFLNREVPREPLVFILRCFGAEVSWDKTTFVGATFSEDDETITHQIVDRPSVEKKFISRYYVQPQWVFDCVNRRELIPTDQYLIGAELPAHLSPFVSSTSTTRYVPPEERALHDPTVMLNRGEDSDEISSAEEEDEDDESENNSDSENEEGDENEMEQEQISHAGNEKLDNEALTEEERKEKLRQEKKAEMAVAAGKVPRFNPYDKFRSNKEEQSLIEKMIPRKKQYLYNLMMKRRQERASKVRNFARKRELIEKEEKIKRKVQKKIERKKSVAAMMAE
ncbi:unnamed protein product [Bemisia tabaci]|uniref:Pescadillo homolog n=1 Tax=Bemisia tabaci TaxID=7038 RepID=A0A9P0AFJ9_BEMTA|nr:unnamed protein product [Bemisia tabaci]